MLLPTFYSLDEACREAGRVCELRDAHCTDGMRRCSRVGSSRSDGVHRAAHSQPPGMRPVQPAASSTAPGTRRMSVSAVACEMLHLDFALCHKASQLVYITIGEHDHAQGHTMVQKVESICECKFSESAITQKLRQIMHSRRTNIQALSSPVATDETLKPLQGNRHTTTSTA